VARVLKNALLIADDYLAILTCELYFSLGVSVAHSLLLRGTLVSYHIEHGEILGEILYFAHLFA